MHTTRHGQGLTILGLDTDKLTQPRLGQSGIVELRGSFTLAISHDGRRHGHQGDTTLQKQGAVLHRDVVVQVLVQTVLVRCCTGPRVPRTVHIGVPLGLRSHHGVCHGAYTGSAVLHPQELAQSALEGVSGVPGAEHSIVLERVGLRAHVGLHQSFAIGTSAPHQAVGDGAILRAVGQVNTSRLILVHPAVLDRDSVGRVLQGHPTYVVRHDTVQDTATDHTRQGKAIVPTLCCAVSQVHVLHLRMARGACDTASTGTVVLIVRSRRKQQLRLEPPSHMLRVLVVTAVLELHRAVREHRADDLRPCLHHDTVALIHILDGQAIHTDVRDVDDVQDSGCRVSLGAGVVRDLAALGLDPQGLLAGLAIGVAQQDAGRLAFQRGNLDVTPSQVKGGSTPDYLELVTQGEVPHQGDCVPILGGTNLRLGLAGPDVVCTSIDGYVSQLVLQCRRQ